MATDAKKLSYWQQHFTHWKSSGLSQRDDEAREGLALSTFNYWRKLSRNAPDRLRPPALTLVPVHVERSLHHAILKSPAGWEINLPYTAAADLAVLLKQLP